METLSENIRKYANILAEQEKKPVNELFGLGKKTHTPETVASKLVADLKAKGLDISLEPSLTPAQQVKIKVKLDDISKLEGEPEFKKYARMVKISPIIQREYGDMGPVVAKFYLYIDFMYGKKYNLKVAVTHETNPEFFTLILKNQG